MAAVLSLVARINALSAQLLCSVPKQPKRFLKLSLPQSVRTVSASQIEEYDENGVVCLRQVFDQKWLEMCDRAITKNLQEPSKYNDWILDDAGNLFFNDLMNFKRFPEYIEYVMSSPAAEIAGELMKSEKSIFFHEHVFYKDGGSSSDSPWHHDQPYYPVDGMQNCSIWMPTRPVKLNASVKFIKGSHKWGKHFFPRKFKGNTNYINLGESGHISDEYHDIDEVMARKRELEIVSWEMQPGDCIAFHMKTIHGTEKAVSSDKRIVMVTRWLGDDAVFTKRLWETSPPGELLPTNLKAGDRFSDCNSFTVPWKRYNNKAGL